MLGLTNVIVGGALLVAGRKLFWLFIGALGFITGIQVTTSIWHGPDWLLLVIGVIVGTIFAVLATFLQALAIGIAGFLGGGYVITILTGMLSIEIGIPAWIIYIIGGIIGVAFVSFLFDWAIITISSLAGASLITSAIFSRSNTQLIFMVIFFIGVTVQGSLMRNEEHIETQE